METNLKKIGQFLIVVSVLFLTNCISDEKTKETKIAPDTNQTFTYREMMNKPLIVSFKKPATYEILFKSDSSFYWKSLRTGNIGDVKTNTIILDDYKVLTHWIENDSTIVNILTDFENMTINGFETFKNHKTISLIGKLTVKE